jgi:hypothetical protein
VIDGATQGGTATKSLANFDSQPSTQVWIASLAAGAHTIKLQCQKSAALATCSVQATETMLSILLIDHS